MHSFFSLVLILTTTLILPALSPLHAAVNSSSPQCTWLNGRASSYQLVTNAEQLQAAVNSAGWGKMIELAGDRDYNFGVGRPLQIYNKDNLYICGPRSAKIKGSGWSVTGNKAYGIHVLNSQYVLMNGFSIENAAKGVVSDFSSHNTYQDLKVGEIGHEGIHLRSNSSNNEIVNCLVDNTGLLSPAIGEGVYIGSSNTNWGTATAGITIPGPDRSNYNYVHGNDIKNTRAEPIDVKEGTEGGNLEGNRLNGWLVSGYNFNGATSCIDMKAVNYTVKNNTCWLGNSSFHMIEVHDLGEGSWGNKVTGNTVYGGAGESACYQNQTNCNNNGDFSGNNFSRSCNCQP